MSDRSRAHGGRRANQTGRPPKADRKIRIGTLFLAPDAVARLAERTHDGETLLDAARRILLTRLDSPDPEGSAVE